MEGNRAVRGKREGTKEGKSGREGGRGMIIRTPCHNPRSATGCKLKVIQAYITDNCDKIIMAKSVR